MCTHMHRCLHTQNSSRFPFIENVCITKWWYPYRNNRCVGLLIQCASIWTTQTLMKLLVGFVCLCSTCSCYVTLILKIFRPQALSAGSSKQKEAPQFKDLNKNKFVLVVQRKDTIPGARFSFLLFPTLSYSSDFLKWGTSIKQQQQ